LLEREVRQVLADKSLRETFRKRDLWVVGSAPAETAARIKAGFELWRDVVKRTGMKAN
jgi:hypothetical protein